MSLDTRMKIYENIESERRFLPLLPICARLDGKCFHQFTKKLNRPYDVHLSTLMESAAKYLLEETQALIGYTQSDEISLIWYSDDYKSQIFFDGRIQKMNSVLTSLLTAFFNNHLTSYLRANTNGTALFDCRVWQVPTQEEAVNMLIWRELDATRNSISMAAHFYYSHSELQGKSSDEQQEMLFQKGVNWNEHPVFFKRGSYFQKQKVLRSFTAEEIDKLPVRHEARKNPDLKIERTEVKRLSLPPLTKVTNRVAVIFYGAEPEIIEETQVKK